MTTKVDNELGWNHQFVGVNGIQLHYVRQGAGAPLILIHGWPEFWLVWRKIIPALAKFHDVVALDLRGFGESEKPAGKASDAYTLSHHVTDLAALIDTLGFEKVGLVSHDIGANIAQGYARLRPDRVDGLFFFDCPYPGIGKRWADPKVIPEIWYQHFNQLPWAADWVGMTRQSCEQYFRHFLNHWSHAPGTFDEDLPVWIDNFMMPGNLQGGFNWYTAFQDARVKLMRDGAPTLPPIPIRTRVRWGASDKVLLPEFTDKLGDYFSDLDVKIVERAGHFVAYERPEYAIQEIGDFFSRAPTRI